MKEGETQEDNFLIYVSIFNFYIKGLSYVHSLTFSFVFRDHLNKKVNSQAEVP